MLKIPNFVGVCGRPVYPVTEPYAKHVLIVYKPWRKYPSGKKTNWIAEFNKFINEDAPKSAQMTYQRVFRRWVDKMTNYEPIAGTVEHNRNPIDMSTNELLDLTGMKRSESTDHDFNVMKNMHRGLHYQWNRSTMVSYSDVQTSTLFTSYANIPIESKFFAASNRTPQLVT